MAETYSAGIVTAYGAAVRGGYTGTYEQWCEDMAQLGDNVAEVREKAEQVEQTAQEFTEQTVPAAIQSVEDKGTEQVNTVETAGTTQVQEIDDTAVLRIGAVNAAGAAQVQDVNTAGATQVQAVNTAGQTALAAVSGAQTAAVSAVQTESTTQRAAIQQKGEDTIESIPTDYTALSDEVDDLKSAFVALEENDYNGIAYQVDGVGRVRFDTGNTAGSSDTNFSHTGFIDVSRYKSLKYKKIGVTSATSTAGMAFYNSEREFIPGSGVQVAVGQSVGGYLVDLSELTIPDGAHYARFSTLTDIDTYGTFELYGYSILADKIYNKEDNVVDTYNAAIETPGQGENVGEIIKVVSYNVAKYDNDTDPVVYIPTDKQINFKKMLSQINPDFIATQEDRHYITGGSGTVALTALYNPIFPYEYIQATGGQLRPAIRSKKQAISNGQVVFSNGRWTHYATFEINNKILLLTSTHPVASYNNTDYDSAESIAARLTQYTELFQWFNGSISLKNPSGADVSCPSYEWLIAAGDYNTLTQTDKDNLTNLAKNNGYKLANGEWLGWLETNYRFDTPLCLDNVIASSNVIFNSITAHSSMHEMLYSDHVPFEVVVTLLNS
jgi:hypothetical protein